MRNPAVYIDGDGSIERAIRELQDLIILHRGHIQRIDQRLDAIEQENRNHSERMDDRFANIRKDIDRLKGTHGT